MKKLDWDAEKNKILRAIRKISFEDIEEAVESGGLLDTIDNPNKIKYPNQQMFVVEFNSYVYLVPFVEDEEKNFLKTIYPSRKMTKKYLKKGKLR